MIQIGKVSGGEWLGCRRAWHKSGALPCEKTGSGQPRATQAPWHAVNVERLVCRRPPSRPLFFYFSRSFLSLLHPVPPLFQAKNAKFEEVMARLQSAFAPRQVARLLLWVSANRAHIAKLPLLSKDMLQRQQQKHHQQQRRRQQHQPSDGNGSSSSSALPS